MKRKDFYLCAKSSFDLCDVPLKSMLLKLKDVKIKNYNSRILWKVW